MSVARSAVWVARDVLAMPSPRWVLRISLLRIAAERKCELLRPLFAACSLRLPALPLFLFLLLLQLLDELNRGGLGVGVAVWRCEGETEARLQLALLVEGLDPLAGRLDRDREGAGGAGLRDCRRHLLAGRSGKRPGARDGDFD